MNDVTLISALISCLQYQNYCIELPLKQVFIQNQAFGMKSEIITGG
jgi:hypothetical protein